jgi:hypothetical protein
MARLLHIGPKNYKLQVTNLQVTSYHNINYQDTKMAFGLIY